MLISSSSNVKIRWTWYSWTPFFIRSPIVPIMLDESLSFADEFSCNLRLSCLMATNLEIRPLDLCSICRPIWFTIYFAYVSMMCERRIWNRGPDPSRTLWGAVGIKRSWARNHASNTCSNSFFHVDSKYDPHFLFWLKSNFDSFDLTARDFDIVIGDSID